MLMSTVLAAPSVVACASFFLYHLQWREEHQLRIYEQFQRPDLGDAEGVM
jgi:hypothetical protein